MRKDNADEVTRVTFPRDDVAETRKGEMLWYDKFKASEKVTDENVRDEDKTRTDLLSMETHQQWWQ